MVALLAGCPTGSGDDDSSLRPDDDDATAGPDDDDSSFDDDDSAVSDDDDLADDDDLVDDDDSGPVFDCATAPGTAGAQQIIPGARGFHGLAIDGSGLIVGSDGWSLVRASYDGAWSVWMPAVGTVQQLAYLPGGDLVYASTDSGSIQRLTPSGGLSQLAPIDAYGVIVGPDGDVWTAGPGGSVVRVDPDTGALTTVTTLADGTPRSIDFSPDLSRLYIGNVSSNRVYGLDLDASLEPIGSPWAFVDLPGTWHDAVAIDICGYVYIPEAATKKLYRINPSTGEVVTFADWSASVEDYGHGAIWGTGSHGWRQDAIYAPMPYGENQVREIVVGVPGRQWEGTAINRP